ncbi:MAG TPA: VTT domain-containing protein [Rhodoferax sp.]
MTAVTDMLVQLLQANGLLLLFPLAVIEGPIVTVIAGWLARLGYFPLGRAVLILVVADLVGDSLLYGLGRAGPNVLPQKLRQVLGVTDARIALMAEHFSKQGGRTLIAAKLTHSFGFVVLVAAGASRMSFPAFLCFNLVGTIPKTLFFLLVGYAVGEAHVTIDNWIGRASLGIVILGVAILSIWYWKKKKERR